MRSSLGLAIFFMASIAGATVPPSHHGGHRHHAAPPRAPSASLGYANSGRLQHAARLEEDEALRYVPGRPLHYGTDELISALHRAARTVYRRHHTRLSVGDLSAPGGGPVGHHASHQSGRDADLGFYVTSAGEPVPLMDYVSFRQDGTPFLGGPLRFDTSRNWSLMEALLTDPAIQIEHVFVSSGLRSLLIQYARSHGVDEAVVERAASALHQPPRGSPHTNHFHVRIACPAGDASCVEGIHRPPPRRHRHPRAVAGNSSHRARHEQEGPPHAPHANRSSAAP
ncbi:MAG: penicillin-insensitive murein endopeptidase [Deltaproteobacteria bacterium]